MRELLTIALTSIALSLCPAPAETEPIVQVQAHSGIDGSLIQQAQSLIDCIPDVYLNKFQELGWSVYIVDWDINNEVFDGKYSSVAGVTLTASREIYIENRVTAVSLATVHEFGHFVDYMYSDTNCRHVQEDFQVIYEAEAKTSGFYDSQMEWFAELFAMTYLEPVETALVCPKGYRYIRSLEDNL